MTLRQELEAVGIRGRLRDRILAEVADHTAEGGDVGDPRDLARQFADDLAPVQSRRAAFAAFTALALAGLGYAIAWLEILGGTQNLASGRWVLPGVAAALGILICPQISFVAGVLAVLRALRMRGSASDVALLLTRTRVALASGALAMVSVAVYAYDYRLASWVVLTGAVLTIPLAGTALLVHRAAAVTSSVPGDAGDVFDDIPVRLPRRYGLLCVVTAGAVALATFAAAPTHEGLRNAIAEVVFVAAGWFALGRRLGLRR